jgi:cation diffusion facilitator CzcD-associated flavoprotein CzcO
MEKPPTSKLIPEPGPHIIDTDIVIVGGGIAGASLACALSESEFFLQD